MKRMHIVAGAALLVLLMAGAAIASEGGGEHGLPWGNFIARTINFVLFLGIIWYAAGKKIKELFTGRQDKIRNELADLDSRRKEAEGKLSEVEQNIANLNKEREAILEQSREQGERLKAAIIKEAEAKAVQIKAQAETAIQTERKVALEGIREEIADMIVEATEEILRKKLKAAEQQKLVDKYIKRVVLN
ncbi:MAG: F0F1 ATP synthase subunit B [Desulfovibrio sp.]|uniref:F0F1 ATP synthase subunit B n=1 Tax=Desulfovibrio sp. 7SRBS1 TaxID=3378064 RepID=UPI003B42294E